MARMNEPWKCSQTSEFNSGLNKLNEASVNFSGKCRFQCKMCGVHFVSEKSPSVGFDTVENP